MPDATKSKAEVMAYVLARLFDFLHIVCTLRTAAPKHRQLLGRYYRKLRQWVGDYPRTEQDETWSELVERLPKNAGFLGWDRPKRLNAWVREWGVPLGTATSIVHHQPPLRRPWPCPPPRKPPIDDPILQEADEAVKLAAKTVKPPS